MAADLDGMTFDIASHANVRVVKTVPLDVSGLAATIAGLVVYWAAAAVACCMSHFEACLTNFSLFQPLAIVRRMLSPASRAR